MPAAAVQTLEDPIYEEFTRTSAPPPAETGRPEPRFRVVTRKPLPMAPRRRPNGVRNALLLAAVPCTCLLVYVLFWTMAIRGGMKLEFEQRELARMKVEQRDLLALKTRLTSPGAVLASAVMLGMEPAHNRLFGKAKGAAPATLAE